MLLDIGAIRSASDGGTFTVSGMKSAICNGSLQLPGRKSNTAKNAAKDVRDVFKTFFNSASGDAAWQNEYINK